MQQIISRRGVGPATPGASAGAPGFVRSRFLLAVTILLLCAIGSAGSRILWSYQTTHGLQLSASVERVSQSRISRSKAQSTPLLFTHPDCTRTATTLHELERVPGSLQASGKSLPAIRVVIAGAQTKSGPIDRPLPVKAASKLPGAAVIPDPDVSEARLFDARTSGQILLYKPAGRLIFPGGITAARGLDGATRGADQLVRSLTDPQTPARFPVFGSSRFNSGDATI